MITFHVDQIEVLPIVGIQKAEFTFRFTVTQTDGEAQSVALYIEFDAGTRWYRAATRTTTGGTIEYKKVMYAKGARRVRIVSAYPAVKLTGETRKSFTVLPLQAWTAAFTQWICEPCQLGADSWGEIEVSVYYRHIDRSMEGRAGAKHNLRIEAVDGDRVTQLTNEMPADAPGWFVSDIHGTVNAYEPGRYMVKVTPVVGSGRTLGRDRVVYVDSATENAFRPAVDPAEEAVGFVQVYPNSRTRIDFVFQAEETWSDRTNGNIGTLHPEIADDVKNVINKIEGYEGVQATVTNAFRSFAEQDALYAIGRGEGDTRTPVTNARGGYSYHNYGLAVDVYDIQGETLTSLSESARSVFSLFGLAWGGSFGDPPHYEKSFGLGVEELLRRHNAGDFLTGTTFVDVAP